MKTFVNNSHFIDLFSFYFKVYWVFQIELEMKVIIYMSSKLTCSLKEDKNNIFYKTT